MTKQRQETQHTETWIYKINTKDPKLEDLVLERVFREAIKCNVYGDGAVAVSNRHLVRVGQIGRRGPGLADREGVCIIQSFDRMGWAPQADLPKTKESSSMQWCRVGFGAKGQQEDHIPNPPSG